MVTGSTKGGAMQFTVNGKPLEVALRHLMIAGWTGRDREALESHIAEMVAVGIAAPATVPIYYPIAAALLTGEEVIQVVGPQTSGEVEPMLLQVGRRRYLGLASDHTDRALAGRSIGLAKQVCAKPCATALWPWEEVADRLDDLRLESWIMDEASGDWLPYQRGTLAAIRPLAELAADSGLMARADDGPAALLCGTLGVLTGGVRAASRFRMSLVDEMRGRAIRHQYEVEELPEIR